MSEGHVSDMETQDTQFGRQAAAKADEADRIAADGGDPAAAPEDDTPRAGNKAEGGGTPSDDLADEESKESFPASDPPAEY